MDPSLDSLLDASSPPVARRGPELTRELSALVADTETAVQGRRRRLRSRIALTGAGAVVLSGLGVGASAAGVLPAPHWAPWYQSPVAARTQVVSTGAPCEVSYGVKPVHDPAHPVSGPRQALAVAEATRFVRDFDFSTIDLAAALDDVPATAQLSGAGPEERETFAVLQALQQRLDRHLEGRGLPAAVSVSTAQTCTGGAR